MMAVDVFTLIGALILCSGIALLLRQRTAEQSFLFTVAVCCGCFFLIMLPLQELLSLFSSLTVPFQTRDTEILLKSFGIGIATEFGSAVCFDHGQRAFAKQLETAGRLTILLLCAPMLQELVDLLSGMVNR